MYTFEEKNITNELYDEERQSDSDVKIREMLQYGNYVVVLDTNILLKIYRSSPDYAEFVLECLECIKDYVYVPFNVSWEYEKHRKDEYSKKVKSIENVNQTCHKLIIDIRNKVKGQCEELAKNGYPEIDELIEKMTEKVDELDAELDSYFGEHQDLDFLNRWNEDKVLRLKEKFTNMPEPSAAFIYKQCQEGEYRYKKEIPPGYKDNKKDGVSKYGDLLVWSETYTFAAQNSKNIIFVTDDVKEDWWDRSDDGRILFRKELIKEFSRYTRVSVDSDKCLKLVPLTGYDLYKAIARDYDIEAPDAVLMILDATDEAFVDAVSEKVFDMIWSDIAYSGTSFLDEDSAHVGSEGVDEWEIEAVEFDDYERTEVDSGIATYIFTYRIRISGASHEYWGRDDDTKEIVTSPDRKHECSGTVKVIVTREVETVIDWNEDFEFRDADISNASIFEDSYEDVDSEYDVYCSECGIRMGYEWESFQHDYDGNPVCDDCMTTNENGFVCPGCGLKYPEMMRGASGTFCRNCEDEFDV
jgi:hypothetical protein